MNHPYIALDDSLEASTEQDLFLSFHPDTRKFAPEVNNPIGQAAAGAGIATDGVNAANMRHEQVL